MDRCVVRAGAPREAFAMIEMLACVGTFAVLKWTYDLFELEGWW